MHSITFSPDGLKISGSSIELHTFFRRVVFPAFALPMMRVRKCLHLLRYSIALSMSSGRYVRGSQGKDKRKSTEMNHSKIVYCPGTYEPGLCKLTSCFQREESFDVIRR